MQNFAVNILKICLQDECTTLILLQSVTAIKNKRKQDVQSPASVSVFFNLDILLLGIVSGNGALKID